jgi:hypothetical protein
MLLTPYAEVFGYRLSAKFLAVTIGSHLVYGAVLWASLIGWEKLRGAAHRRLKLTVLGLFAVLGVAAVAADFHGRHAATIPPSPPAYVGEHLYTTWNVVEPDRLVVVWAALRYVDPEARFHFVEPFSHVRVGEPLDVPEADIRRGGTRSATETLFADLRLAGDERLDRLAEMTHLFEIARWQLPSRPAAYELGQELTAAAGSCEPQDVEPCFERGVRFLDDWYGAE